MSISRVKKENTIMLPNKEKLPVGKIKEVSKFLNLVSAEYGIEEDISYFSIEKDKYVAMFKLQYMPRHVSELHSINAKKFVIYELIRINYACTIKTDDELNKRAIVISDLLNKMDDTCKETITSKLNTMFDIPGELDYLLDQLLTDLQFNSFKYKVLDNKKTPCLLCVNGDGIFVRATEAPFDIVRQLIWPDIGAIKSRTNKLIFRMKSGQTEEMVCDNKKTAAAACDHLMSYLEFVEGNAVRVNKGKWFDSFTSRLRQSFSKRARSHDTAQSPSSKSHTPISHVHNTVNTHNATTTVVSDECADSHVTLVESPTNRITGQTITIDSSPREHNRHNDSSMRQSNQDDHMSVKTNSTYEVSCDGLSPRTLSNDSYPDNDSSGPGTGSFGQSISTKNSPLALITSVNKDSPGFSPPIDNLVKNKTTKIVPVPPPQIPTRKCELQSAFTPEFHCAQFDTVKSAPPPPPIRSPQTEVQQLQELTRIDPPAMFAEVQVVAVTTADDDTLPVAMTTECSASILNDSSMRSSRTETSPPESIIHAWDCGHQSGSKIEPQLVMDAPSLSNENMKEIRDLIVVNESEVQLSVTTNCYHETNVGEETAQLPEISLSTVKETAIDPARSAKVECKLPVYQRKSIPSPKIQRPSRIPSSTSSHDPPSPTTTSRLIQKAHSPSDKENYNASIVKSDKLERYPDMDDISSSNNANFGRFDNEDYKVDSEATVKSVSSAAGNITKKSAKTEVSSVKVSGIPAPKQYKTTTSITSAAKKPTEPPKSPVIGAPRVSGIPRMSSK